MRKRVLVLLVAALGGLLLVATGPARPAVERLAFSRITYWLRSSAGLELTAASLDISPFSLTVTLRSPQLAAVGHLDKPLLVADVVTVDLDWRILGGRLALDRLVVDTPRVAIHRPGNVPETEGGGAPDGFPVVPLDVKDFDLEIVTPHVSVAVTGVTINLERQDRAVSGTLETAGGIEIVAGPVRLAASGAAADVAFDGHTLLVRELTVRGDELSWQASGSVGVAGSAPALDLNVTGQIGLAAALTGLDDPLVGTVVARARIYGPLAAPAARAELSAASLSWSDWRADSLRAEVAFEHGRLTVASLHGQVAGGTLDVNGEVDLAGQAPGSVRARWIAATGPVGLDIGLQARGAGRRWKVAATTDDAARVRASADVTFGDRAGLDAALDGSLSVRAPDMRRLVDRLADVGVPLGSLDSATVSGALTGEAAVSGTLERPRIRGTVTGTSLAAAALPVSDVAGSFDLTLPDGRSTGQFTLEAPEVAFRAAGQDDWLRGAFVAAGQWTGTVTDPVLTVSVTGDRVTATPVGQARVSARAQYRWPVVSVREFSIVPLSGGRIEGTGTMNVSETTGTLNVAGSNLDLTVPASIAGDRPVSAVKASLVAQLSGRPGDIRGTARITSGDVRAGTRQAGPATLSAEFQDDHAAVVADLPHLPLALSADVGLVPPYRIDGIGRVTNADLESLVGLLGVSPAAAVSGRATADIHFAGEAQDAASWSGSVAVAPGEVTAYGLAIRAPAGLAARLVGGRWHLDRTQVSAAGLTFIAEADLPVRGEGGTATLAFDGSLDGLRPWLEGFTPGTPWTIDGQTTGRLTATRTAAGISVGGAIRAAAPRIARDDRTLAENVVVDVTLDRGRVSSRALSASIDTGTFEARVDAPLVWLNEWLPVNLRLAPPPEAAAGSFQGRIQFDLATFLAAAGYDLQQPVTGGLSIAIDATSSRPALDAVTGVITVERADVTTTGQTVRQTRPTVFRLAGERLTIESLEWRGPNTTVSGEGYVGLGDTRSELRLRADTTLQFVDALFPGRASGRLDLTASLVRNPGAEWQTVGEAVLSNGRWLISDLRLLLSEWSGRIQFARGTITVPGLGGRLNGGTIHIDGLLARDPQSTSAIRLEARDVLLSVFAGLHSQVVGDLEWRPRRNGTVIGGVLRVTASQYREPVTRMIELVEQLAPAPGAEPPSTTGLLAETALDIVIDTTDPVVIDNSLGSIELEPRLRLVGTLAAPALSGDVRALDDGRIRLGGRAYRLRESSLTFSPATGRMPTLDVTGETKVGEYDVTLRVTGTAASLETTFTSSPPLGERDLRSLLVTGRAEASEAAASDELGLEVISADILGFAGKFVGLDSVRLGSADLDLVNQDSSTAQHLTVSKSLGRYFEIILSENLEQSHLTWMIVLRPRPGYSVRAASIEDREGMIEFRQEVTFGPGRLRTTPEDRAQREPPQARRTVTQVDIEGTPGFDPEVLRARLALSAGKRFDVRRWIEDRVGIEKFYRGRGYHQARIVPTREDDSAGGTPGIRLRYDIERGPISTIDVVGEHLPREVLDDMYLTWGAMPVPELLEDELAAIARRHLAARGYLGADVRVGFETPVPGHERARLTILPGQRSTSFGVAWLNNQAVASADLDAAVNAHLSNPSALLDADRLLRPARRAYASRGFFAARLSPQPIRIEGDQAVLPVRVTEGPRAHVASVVVNGVEPARQAALFDVIALPVGSTFGSAAGSEAEQRVAAWYDDHGYRDAEVGHRIERATDGATAVIFSVMEGPRYVVDDVRVTGVESTAAGLVRGALALSAGAPASQENARATERSLYDIGSFRDARVTFDRSEAAASEGVVPVTATVRLQETRRFQLRYGMQVSSDYTTEVRSRSFDWGAGADLRDRNFLGRAMQLSLAGRYQPGLRTLALQVASPRTFGRPVRTNVYSRWRLESDEFEDIALSDTRVELSLEQRWRPRPAIELTWGYRVTSRTFEFTILEPREFASFGGVLAGPTVSIVIDRRDDPFDPKTGWYHTSSYQLGVRPLGSDLAYARYLMRQSKYLTLGPLTLLGSMRWGTLEGYSGTVPLSAIDLFFTTGGSNSVRGYPEGSLAAVQVNGLLLGGTELLGFTGEVTYPIFRFIRGAAFADAGNTFVGAREIAWRRIAAGAGLGLRVSTPLAPLRLDVAYPVTHSFGYRTWRFHFSVGQIF